MKKFCVLAFLIGIGAAQAQNIGNNKAAPVSFTRVTVTIGVGAAKTIWFSLPPDLGYKGASPAVDTAAAVDPPARVSWNGNGALLVRLSSGSVSDSTRILAQGIDDAGNLIDNNDNYLSGSASTFASVFSNNNAKTFQLSGLFDPLFGFKFTITQGDLTGGNRVYEVKFVPQ
jgi:hypothetical protein